MNADEQENRNLPERRSGASFTFTITAAALHGNI
jgi:hypothetical protein